MTVSRQLYRSGESKYLINNAECRLKDVIELFMDTGLSKGAYSIISQGQISSILTANPYDRRLIFEEAAGIVKYKTRKKIALSKLEAAKQDLLRVSDILIELERQLRSLKYQAAKAERYKKVAEQLELTELLVSFFEYSALVEEITNINNERQIYLDKKTEIETKIAKENSEYEKQKITLFEIDTKVSEISKKIYELSEAIKQKEYKLMSNSNKIDNNLFKINQYSDETRELKFKIEELDKKINEENSQLLNASVKLLENIIDSEREKKNILDIENVLSENNKILDEYNKELLNKTHNSSEYKSRLSAITTELRTVKIQQQEIKEEKINKELQIANINEEQKILEENLSNVEKSHIEITETLNKFQEELNANIGHLEKLRNKQFEYKNLLLNARADLKVILDSEDEKYQDGIKELFDYLKKNNLSLAHKGLIGEHIKTEEIYEVAIGNALNELIQTIVIEDNNTLKETIDLITKKSLGKTRFLCAAESAEEKNQALEISKERGFLASAADVISCKNKEMNDIVKKIFSKIAIAQDYDSGIALKKKYSDFIFVTIDGIIFWNDGTITAGFVKENRNILKRDRQKEELVQKIEFFGKTLKEIENHIIELETHQIELKKNINNIQRTQKELELEKNGITNKLDNNKKSLITLENELTKISEKIMILNSRENELIELEKKINIELLEINNKSEKISLKIKSLSEKIENIKLEKNEKMKNVNSYDVRCAELKQQQESFKRSMFDKQLLIEDYEKKIENNKKLTVELQNEIEIIKKENEAINIEINNLIKERDKWLNDKNIEQQARENLFAILNNIEEQSKAQ
ncbi:MAG TPA: hypothetical protein PLJ38_05195, partial [bacterium]|nr:hypothetical protein [bacterium]